MSAPLSATENMLLVPGSIIGGKYRIDNFLGAGGMGVVLSATHLELDAPVAIKVVREELAQNEQIVSRLLFEARAAARMRSAHIVRVLDVARLDSGAPYIVMEQLQGWDLQAVLTERGALSVREAIRHILQACEGLAEAHGLGIVHRDLKPENLFLATTPEGLVLKILDFGLSKDLQSPLASGPCTTLTKDGTAVGTPYYMSPEQMRVSPTLDARADIWSLGAILFELLTGSCPFEADTPARLCVKVMVEDAPSLLHFSKSAPAALDAIVRRCLQKDPAARFQTVTELADALRDFVANTERAIAMQAQAREAKPAEATSAEATSAEATPAEATPAEATPTKREAPEPTPTSFAPAEPKPPPHIAGRVWLSASVLLGVCAVFGYWQFQRSFVVPSWISPQPASSVALTGAASVQPKPQPEIQPPPTLGAIVVSLGTAAAASASASGPASVSTSVSTPRRIAGPKFYTPPAPPAPPVTAAAAPQPDSPEARYGL